MKKDGSNFPQEISFTAMESGGLICVVHDITKRKRAEGLLRTSERQYRNLFEEMDEGFCVIEMLYDPDGKAVDYRFVEINPAFEKQTGLQQALGKTIRQMVPNHDAHWFEIYGKVARTGESIRFESRTDATQRHYDVYAFRVGEDRSQRVGILFNDITVRKNSEEALLNSLSSLKKAVGTTIQVMVSAVEARDPYTAGHQIRVADLACSIAMEMGLPQEIIDGIGMAGSIHDIGKLSIPAEILSKPTKLSEIEFSLIKEHARQGYEILKDVETPRPLAEIVYQHHERKDGSGYPRNLKGDEILIEARILAVADVVEAMASHRPYRPGLGIDKALEEIEKNRGISYDHTVADACLKLFREKGFQFGGT
jgi:PAS domain S-box-containing protein/putative nucleotidyltransferase with HDIG domain